MSNTDVVRQLVVHPAAWLPLVGWLQSRGLDVARMPITEDDLPTYVIVIPPIGGAASDG